MKYPVGTHVRAKVQISNDDVPHCILCKQGDELVIRKGPDDALMYDLYASRPDVADGLFRVYYDEIEAI